MRYLLDTSTLIWMVAMEEKLNQPAKKAIRSSSNEMFLSVVSIWEIVIKNGSGRLRLEAPPTEALPEWQQTFGLQTISITQQHAFEIGNLPLYHQDPFDRMLIAQAITEELVLITADETIMKYPVRTLWCGK